MAHRIEWNEYESFGGEPAFYRYHLSPGEEDALLDDGVFLKRRVWRRMNEIRRHRPGSKNAKNNPLRKVHLAGRRGI